MAKALVIDPKQRRRPDSITFREIPVNAYQKSVKDEKDNFSKDDLLRIYRDMLIIRDFETMLNEIKTKGEYEGITYDYPGPAHLGIGQEAAYVGQAYELGAQDFIFGSHRSHGEILAKGLSAIQKTGDEELQKIMREYFGGAIYRAVESATKASSVKEFAKEFLIYGVLAEIFGRENGFNKGLGGSMHAFFIPFGSFPNSSTRRSDASSIEFESPNVHTNASTACMVVLYSSANLTALSESRKHSMKASANVIIIRGFLCHPRKL